AKYFAFRSVPAGISPRAAISATAKLGDGVSVGPFSTIADDVVLGDGVIVFQNVSIESGSVIGDGTVIYPQMSIYEGSIIGKRCIIHSGTVIGADGYGFATHGGRHHKIPQIGIVRIGDDVEIGAGCTIDRAALGETSIGDGTKIDDQVMIGHNVKVGKHCLLVAQVGIAGSTELGDYVVVAGQSGFGGHLTIGNRVQVAAKSAVLDDVADGEKVMGIPAIPFRQFAAILGLRDMPDREKKLFLFGGVDKARFRRPVVPGDQLRLECVVLHRRSISVKIHGKATVDGQLVAEAELFSVLIDRPE